MLVRERDEVLRGILLRPARGHRQVPGAGDPGHSPGAADHGRDADGVLDRRIRGGLPVGVAPEAHHRELALVEEVLRAGPVELRGPGRRVGQQADVEVERRLVLRVVDRHLAARRVEHHLRLTGLRHRREPLGLDRTLHVGSVEVDGAVAVGVAREEFRDVAVLLPGRGRGEGVAVLRLEVGLVRRILEQVRAVEEDLRVRPHRHPDVLPVDLRLVDQAAEQVVLDVVGEQIVEGGEPRSERGEPDGIQRGDVERRRAGLELGLDAVVEAVVGQLDERDVGALLLLVEVGDRLEFGLAAALDDDREGGSPLGCSGAAAGTASGEDDGGRRHDGERPHRAPDTSGVLLRAKLHHFDSFESDSGKCGWESSPIRFGKSSWHDGNRPRSAPSSAPGGQSLWRLPSFPARPTLATRPDAKSIWR